MRQLIDSFRTHLGQRGCHFYGEDSCNFLHWNEVLQFLETFTSEGGDEFASRLLTALSNYNPDIEFLAVHQEGETVSVELYSEHRKYEHQA